MKPEPNRPYGLKAGGGWTYRFGPEFVIKAGERGQGRRLAFVELTTRAGEEPGDHTHPTEDEIFYVLNGKVAFRCGDEQFELADGGFVFLPRGLQHGFTIRSSGDVRMLIVTSPADGDAIGGWGGLIGDLEDDGE
jgi:quercetin dioxygenase-like cupin family protein